MRVEDEEEGNKKACNKREKEVAILQNEEGKEF